jgi:DNA-binding MarR family transcriptional regulator
LTSQFNLIQLLTMVQQPAPEAGRVTEIHSAIDCLGRLSEAFSERRAQLAQGVGLTDQQWGVLEEISTEHFMPSMFARRRESSAAAVSKILRQLNDKGLISVGVSESDGRPRKYELTARGKQVMAALRRSRERAIRDVWLPFDAEQVRQFINFSTLLVARLEAYARESRAGIGKESNRHGQNAV